MAKARLEGVGITCFLANEHLVGVNFAYSGAVGGVELKVPESEAESAVAVLADLSEIAVCPMCGGIKFRQVRDKSRKNFLATLFAVLFFIPLLCSARSQCEKCGHIMP